METCNPVSILIRFPVLPSVGVALLWIETMVVRVHLLVDLYTLFASFWVGSLWEGETPGLNILKS
jgi:hypothetical protein